MRLALLASKHKMREKSNRRFFTQHPELKNVRGPFRSEWQLWFCGEF